MKYVDSVQHELQKRRVDHIFNHISKLFQRVVEELQKKLPKIKGLHDELKSNFSEAYTYAVFKSEIEKLRTWSVEATSIATNGDANSKSYGNVSQTFVDDCVHYILESMSERFHQKAIEEIADDFANTECFVDYKAYDRWAQTQNLRNEFNNVLKNVKNLLKTDFCDTIKDLEKYMVDKYPHSFLFG